MPQRNPKFHVHRQSIVQMLQRARTPVAGAKCSRIRCGQPSSIYACSLRKKRGKWSKTKRKRERERETEKEPPRDKLAREGMTCIQCAQNLRNSTRKLTSEKCPSVYRGFSRVPTANQEPYTVGCLNCHGSSLQSNLFRG